MSENELKCSRCKKDYTHDNPEINVINHFPWKKPYEKGSKYKSWIGICLLCKHHLMQLDTENKKEFLDEYTDRVQLWFFCSQCGRLNDNLDETATPLWPRCSICDEVNKHSASVNRFFFHKMENKIQRGKSTTFSRTVGWRRTV